MNFRLMICGPLMLALGACTAPLVDDGVKKFHTASVQANTALIANANDVVAVSRFRLAVRALNPPKSTPVGLTDALIDVETTQAFAQYVCAQSSKFALLRARQGVLARLDVSDGELKSSPKKKEDLETKIEKNFGNCTAEVSSYVTLRQAELPSIGTYPRSAEAGLAPAGAMAGLALIGSVAKLLKSAYDGVQAEVKAGHIKDIVHRADTQRLVLTTLDELAKPDQDLVDYCKDTRRDAICAGLLPQIDEGDKQKYTAIGPPPIDYGDVCRKTERLPGPKPVRAHLTIMDNATVYKKWMALRIAYGRYSDLLSYRDLMLRPLPAGYAKLAAFEARRRDLDLAVAQYSAIQPAADIVAEQQQAWANLTALSCGKLTPAEHFAAASAFLDRINVLSGDGKGVSDAWTGYAAIVYPKPETSGDDDKQ